MIRKLTWSDIPKLKLKEPWMEERYKQYIGDGIGPAWIMEDEEGALCSFGAAIYWNNLSCGNAEKVNGVAEVWFILIDKRKILSQMKEVKKHITEESKNWDVHRLQAITKFDFEEGKRFFEFLGFRCETPNGMKSYFPDGSTALLYSRIL